MSVLERYGEIAEHITGSNAVEVGASIEASIRAGSLRAGDPLPTVRDLASHLKLSPTTVSAAYRMLRSRGLVIGRGRQGTRVSPRPPIASSPPAAIPEHVRNLAFGNPDPALLPNLSKALASIDGSPRLYGDAIIHPELERLARAQFEADGIPCESVSVAGGALDAIERILQAHVRPGDRIAVEDPGFTNVIDLVAALGLEPVPVAVDDEGPVPESLAAALARGVQAFVITPRAQNPTGGSVSAARVRELRPLLAAHPDLLIVEDDHMGELAGTEYRTLLDPKRAHRAAVRSVSKGLGPDLRLALVAADPITAARVEGRQWVGIRWVSFVLQQLVVALWKDRKVKSGVAKATRGYAQRRKAAIDALAAEGITAHGVSGHNIWVPVPDEARCVQGLLELGWGVAAGERFRLESAPAVRVTIAELLPEDAKAFAADFKRVMEPTRRTHTA
jgi:DNA-binding transcriptional MocR family regulator